MAADEQMKEDLLPDKKKHAIAPSINMTFKIFVHMFVMCFLAVMEAGKGVSVLFCFKIEIKRKDRLA